MTNDYRSYDPHLLLRDHIQPDQVKWRNRTQPIDWHHFALMIFLGILAAGCGYGFYIFCVLAGTAIVEALQ